MPVHATQWRQVVRCTLCAVRRSASRRAPARDAVSRAQPAECPVARHRAQQEGAAVATCGDSHPDRERRGQQAELQPLRFIGSPPHAPSSRTIAECFKRSSSALSSPGPSYGPRRSVPGRLVRALMLASTVFRASIGTPAGQRCSAGLRHRKHTMLSRSAAEGAVCLSYSFAVSTLGAHATEQPCSTFANLHSLRELKRLLECRLRAQRRTPGATWGVSGRV